MRAVVLLASLCGLVHGLYRVDPLVSIKGGLIRGLQSSEGYAQFLGVPYAVVDESNPFGASIPHPGFDEVFEAYESNLCPQVNNDVAVGTLDCLTLNIYVPSVATTKNLLPVMVWIHGGQFSKGSADSGGISPKFLVDKDVIVVGINYRLGAYGFMCLDHPEVPGNQGLKDQVLALRWIKENIEAFGGNPKEITLFGESAGGVSVNLHLLSSYEKLYQRAIIQSGPAFVHIWTGEHKNELPIKLAEELDFNTTDISEALEYLAAIDAHTLIKAANDLNKAFSFQGNNILTVPCVETEFEGVDHFITEHPRNIESPKLKNTPVIIGYNDNEAAPAAELSGADYYDSFNFGDHLSLDFNFGDDEGANDLVKHFYIGGEQISEDVKLDLSDFAADYYFGYPTQRAVDQLLQNGASSVYRYVFSYNGGRNIMKLALNLNSTGATHADELGYLFDYEQFQGEVTPEDQIVIDRMTTIWTNFAKFGDPTPETSELLPVKWEPVSKTKQPYLDINEDLSLGTRPHHDRMAFWELFYRLYGNYEI
uniref:Carboxylic ester hydrolase n=1 Tax=Heliothis virescens TaxID=7102 RepID=A0A2A4JU91_HELVI